ncbi:DIS3-like exonuclease 2 [Chenopodium quinoa]|uniref:DIS3-like exonuclease 2 n=1 Tax=Chenopodium quinoa TaxID=63459 RepID=A0A803M4J3_CHEQI|nr:DIS3-like exonuclease 2 [Chenopodium quinoa]
MGIMVVEQLPDLHQQSACSEDLVDKKKKRRSNRRSKQNPGSGCNEVAGHASNGFHNDTLSTTSSSSNQLPPNNSSDSTFNSSFSTMHLHQPVPNLNSGVQVNSRSFPTQHTYHHSARLQDDADFIPPHLVNGCNKQTHFDPHLSLDLVTEALQRGEVFQAILRVNAHNRLEAYCTIEGVPTDIRISGIPRQNRAVEGDVVAVKVDSPQLWSKMKGSSGSGSNLSQVDNRDSSVYAEIDKDSSKGKTSLDVESGLQPMTNCSPVEENGCGLNNINMNSRHCSALDSSREFRPRGENEVLNSVEKLYQAVVSSPSKRPTGRVVAIIVPSFRRDVVVGVMKANWLHSKEGYQKEYYSKNTNLLPPSNCSYIQLIPTDPKLPKMIVPVGALPPNIKKRLDAADVSVERELVAARIDSWPEESLLPHACVMRSFGLGGEVESRIEAVLFENAICTSDFSEESLSCLPIESWQVSQTELQHRKDIRNLCVFTIDPSTATDLDDALSIERLSDRTFRVGVHIADVSYFVQPDTPLDVEAQVRSTSVYMLRRKLSMLPALLSENLGSLIPGVDRLTFSIFWDLNASGHVLDRWVGRTVIRSCCKLSYEHAQDIIDSRISINSVESGENSFPQLYGHFSWLDVFQSVGYLNEISKALKYNRFVDGSLRLDNAKVVFLMDEFGVPYDSVLCERKESNFLVEEFMLLANRTAAEIISRAFPDSALLRRHPEPNMRKLKEFEVFCSKHGLELDASSSGSLHRSLEKIKEKLKEDSIFYDIVINYATKPMQLAKYFCTGDATVPEDGWGHFALAVPLYTHFTSPLRRYPDIVVHRTLNAVIEAEQRYLNYQSKGNKLSQAGDVRCFTGMNFDKIAFQSVEGQQALSDAALKHKLSCRETLTDVAAYCNQKKLASRHVKDAVDKLYMWVLLRNNEILLSEARVLGVGPRFMSIYVQKLAIERRIYYDDVDGLIAEWLEATSTLVLNYVHHNNKRFQRRGSQYKPLEEVALVCSPCNLEPEFDALQNDNSGKPCEPTDCVKNSCQPVVKIDPVVSPLTIRVLSTIPVALHAVGGDDGPLDIAARLYVTSYFR